MARPKSLRKITSQDELLERLWMASAKKLLEQLESPDAAMSASQLAAVIKFLSLNSYNAEALEKTLRTRKAVKALKRKRSDSDSGEGAPPERNIPNFDVPPVDAEAALALHADLQAALDAVDNPNR